MPFFSFPPLGFKADWNWLKQFVLPWQGDVKTKHVRLMVLNQNFFLQFSQFLCLINTVKQDHGAKRKQSNPSILGECHPDNTSSFFSKTLPVLLNLLKHVPASSSLTNLTLSFPPQSALAALLFEIAFATCLCHNCVSCRIWKYKSLCQP